jgi:thiol-disulfide isomerase/thioredoxin
MFPRQRFVVIAVYICSVAFAAGGNCSDEPKTDGENVKPSALTDDQLVRGKVIRELLIQGMDYARNKGEWPTQLSELNKSAAGSLTYLVSPSLPKTLGDHIPQELDTKLRSQLKSFIVVCHESLAEHPDGVWVGYADGHIEFVRDQRSLQFALSQFRNFGPSYLTMWDQLMQMRGEASKKDHALVAGTETQLATQTLELKIVDESGLPVRDAKVGYLFQSSDYDMGGKRSRLMTRMGDAVPQAISDADGRVKIQYRWFFGEEDDPTDPVSLVAYHPGRDLIAIESLSPMSFESHNLETISTREVKLQRGIRVAGTVSCIGASKAIDHSLWSAAYIHLLSGDKRPMLYMSKEQRFEFLLPPGEYVLENYGDGVYSTRRFLRLAEEPRQVQLQIDLPAARITALTGNDAPELQRVKAWKNGGPTALKDLRGKWVLLDFWGYWCGPCVESMPELMKLHDEFAKKGLVIVAVHDDSVASIAELDEHLSGVKKDLWNGRDLPFLVAVDGGGEQPIPGSERYVNGATHAVYGIQKWPTTLLIDPRGTLVGERSVRGSELHDFLLKELSPAR